MTVSDCVCPLTCAFCAKLTLDPTVPRHLCFRHARQHEYGSDREILCESARPERLLGAARLAPAGPPLRTLAARAACSRGYAMGAGTLISSCRSKMRSAISKHGAGITTLVGHIGRSGPGALRRP